MATIKENLMQMKGTAGQMLELAYSAVFLQDAKIAAEVDSLYSSVERLEEETLKLLFRIKITDDERIAIIDLADAIKDIANSAVAIAGLAKTKKFPSVIKDAFKEQ